MSDLCPLVALGDRTRNHRQLENVGQTTYSRRGGVWQHRGIHYFLVRADTEDDDEIDAIMGALNDVDLSFDARIDAAYIGTEWQMGRPAVEIAQDVGL